MKLWVFIFFVSSMLLQVYAIAQDSTHAYEALNNVQLIKLQHRANSYNKAIDKQTEKYVEKLAKQEKKFLKKLYKLDSNKAKELMQQATFNYNNLSQKLQQTTQANLSNNTTAKLTTYIPGLDSITTALKFLNNNSIANQLNGYSTKTTAALQELQVLQQKLQQTANIQQLIQERKQQLQDIAASFKLEKYLKKYHETSYYYITQFNMYKQAWHNPEKIEQLALQALQKLPAFQQFFRQYSVLGQLFPEQDVTTASIAGLQTRAQVMAQIQDLAGQLPTDGGGASGMPLIQQQIQEARQAITKLQDKVLNAGGDNSNFNVPNFKPNTQKLKNFKQRLEYGTNIQSQRGNNYFPATSNLGLSVGYKLSDDKIIGLGVSYAMGLGNGWRSIAFSSEGLGLRSYVDIKLKKSFWLSGGYEMNYKNRFSSLDVIRNNGWQQSGLVGISKILSVQSKFFKKTKLQLAWDFLSYQNLPRSQPFVYRINYSF